MGFPGGSGGKESTYSAGDLSLIPGWGRSPGQGNGYPLQYTCLENSMAGGKPGEATVHGVTESDMTEWLSMCMHTYIHTLTWQICFSNSNFCLKGHILSLSTIISVASLELTSWLLFSRKFLLNTQVQKHHCCPVIQIQEMLFKRESSSASKSKKHRIAFSWASDIYYHLQGRSPTAWRLVVGITTSATRVSAPGCQPAPWLQVLVLQEDTIRTGNVWTMLYSLPVKRKSTISFIDDSAHGQQICMHSSCAAGKGPNSLPAAHRHNSRVSWVSRDAHG